MLCSKLHRQKGFNLVLFSYETATQVCNTLTARLIPLVHKLGYRQANLDLEDLWSNQVTVLCVPCSLDRVPRGFNPEGFSWVVRRIGRDVSLQLATATPW